MVETVIVNDNKTLRNVVVSVSEGVSGRWKVPSEPVKIGSDGPLLSVATERIRAGRIQRNQHDVQRAVVGRLRRDGRHLGRLRFPLAPHEHDARETPERARGNRIQSICAHCPYPIDSRCACKA